MSRVDHSERGRLQHIQRTAKLVSALVMGREFTRKHVAELLGTQLAAADRQIQAIEPHLPLVRERRGGRVYIRLDRSRLLGTRKSPPLGTMIAACLGASLSKVFEGTTYEAAMADVVRHVVETSREPGRFSNARRQFVFVARGGEKGLPEGQPLLDELIEAILRGRYVRIRYVGFDGNGRLETIRPLSLAVYEHQLYLLGQGDEGRLHPYRFARIANAEALTKRFEYPDKDSYEPERMFADSFGVFVDPKYPLERVEMSLDPRWAHYVKSHRWHPSQEARRHNGRIQLSLRVRVCPEVIAWILSFGADAHVVSPASLRMEIARRVEQMAQAYRPAPA